MDISVTQFRARCLELIRQVETGGEPVAIKRRGKVVAWLSPPSNPGASSRKPWERLRGSGQLLAEPGEPVLSHHSRHMIGRSARVELRPCGSQDDTHI